MKKNTKSKKNKTRALKEISDKHHQPNSETPELSDLIQLYEIMNEQQKYEGSGIWERFNIMFSVNIVIFGLVAFVFTNHPPYWKIIIVIMSSLGFLLSLWSIYVLQRLWLWHIHWKKILTEMEEGFPDVPYWPRPFSKRPAYLIKKKNWFTTVLLSYTQPFFVIICCIWLILLLFIPVFPDLPPTPTPSVTPTISVTKIHPTITTTPMLSNTPSLPVITTTPSP